MRRRLIRVAMVATAAFALALSAAPAANAASVTPAFTNPCPWECNVIH